MLGVTFKAYSGNDNEWFVIKSHSLFSDTWYCYPLRRWEKDRHIKENFIQCFSTDFIKQKEIHNEDSTLS